MLYKKKSKRPLFEHFIFKSKKKLSQASSLMLQPNVRVKDVKT